MHGRQEGMLPLVLLYRESAYPVLLNRTWKTLTTSSKLGFCTSRMYTATHQGFWLTLSQLQCIYQISLGASSIDSACHRETVVSGVLTFHATLAGE